MRSKVTDEGTQQESFPCLMVSNRGVIVLFKESGKGTVVGNTSNGTNMYIVGESHEMWAMDMFKPFNGKVVLES